MHAALRRRPARARSAVPSRRAVVHDDDVRDERAHAPTTLAMVAGFVEGGNQRGSAHVIVAASPSAGPAAISTDAAASATTLTVETTPIERSGGYDDVTSVA